MVLHCWKSLAFIRITKDQYEMAAENALVCHPKDPLSPWHDSPELFRQRKDIILSLASTTLVLPYCMASTKRRDYLGGIV